MRSGVRRAILAGGQASIAFPWPPSRLLAYGLLYGQGVAWLQQVVAQMQNEPINVRRSNTVQPYPRGAAHVL